ncbi:charged multivesicular body protein 4b [Anomaloglossus baeobatrachus]|uniref:charged multivesicular body protein 4b n=1 Tax=Anomaloglossus baeobatrachus TaxID=238106 RepID=UPI003F50697A
MCNGLQVTNTNIFVLSREWFKELKADIVMQKQGKGYKKILKIARCCSNASQSMASLCTSSCGSDLLMWTCHSLQTLVGDLGSIAALQALKRKKRYEKQLAQIDGTLSTIEFQREALENANTNTEVLKNMGFAAKAMKAAHDNMDIDKVDELMENIADQQELAQEISDAISKPVGLGEDFDDDELLAELEELEQEELDKNLLEVHGPETVPLPNVPGSFLPAKPAKKKQEEDDDDMRELESWAAV